MRERKYVKLRVDMFEDTKSKIIDRMPKRDLIHYVWSRLILLAGKVNKEGDLHMSRNIPYTIETLAIEFNRDIDEIKIALDVLIELEMMEVTEDKVYRVKNFTKHQNIKIKEKIEAKGKEKNIRDKENKVDGEENETIGNKILLDRLEEEACAGKNENCSSKLDEADVIGFSDHIEKDSKPIDKSNDNKENDKISSQHNNKSVILEMKKSQRTNGKKKAGRKKIKDDISENEDINFMDNMEEEKDNNLCCWITEEDMLLKEGEKVVSEWGF